LDSRGRRRVHTLPLHATAQQFNICHKLFICSWLQSVAARGCDSWGYCNFSQQRFYRDITFSTTARNVMTYDISRSTNQLWVFHILPCCSDMIWGERLVRHRYKWLFGVWRISLRRRPQVCLLRRVASHLRMGTVSRLIIRNFWSTNVIIKFKIWSCYVFAIYLNIVQYFAFSSRFMKYRTKTRPHLGNFLTSASIKIFVKERHEMIFFGKPKHLF